MWNSSFYIKPLTPIAALRRKQADQFLVGKGVGMSSMPKVQLLGSTSKGDERMTSLSQEREVRVNTLPPPP